MDVTGYDEKTRALILKVREQHTQQDSSVFRTLARLKKIAKESDDNALYGFVFYNLADACYSLEKGYERFRRHLAKAIYHLQIANDLEQLTRAYNMVGIDACNNGSLDVAYYYFMMTLRTAEQLNDIYLQSLANANIGQVFFELGNLKRAREYMRKSTRQQTGRNMEDTYYYHNLINSWYSDGLISLLMGDIKSAKRADKKIDTVFAESEGRNTGSVIIPVALFRVLLALSEGDEELYKKRSGEMLDMLGEAHQLFDFMSDLTLFCMYMIEHDRLKPVRKILDTISNTVMDTGVVNMMKQVTQIEIAYHGKTGNRNQIMRHLRRQHELDTKMRDERNLIYSHSINLIEEMDAIRRERVELIAENDLLQVQAQTDNLTGIPNRMMMNRLLSNAFERAYSGRHNFGLEILDVDKFKEYNDTYGHQAGDICLQRIAHEIERMTRGEGLHCARYGGDEFVIIYEDRTDEEILEIARKLEKRVHALNIVHAGARKSGRVSVSQGICNHVPQKKNKTWDFLTEADNALYAVKKNLDAEGTKETIRLYHLPGKMVHQRTGVPR